MHQLNITVIVPAICRLNNVQKLTVCIGDENFITMGTQTANCKNKSS